MKDSFRRLRKRFPNLEEAIRESAKRTESLRCRICEEFLEAQAEAHNTWVKGLVTEKASIWKSEGLVDCEDEEICQMYDAGEFRDTEEGFSLEQLKEKLKRWRNKKKE